MTKRGHYPGLDDAAIRISLRQVKVELAIVAEKLGALQELRDSYEALIVLNEKEALTKLSEVEEADGDNGD